MQTRGCKLSIPSASTHLDRHCLEDESACACSEDPYYCRQHAARCVGHPCYSYTPPALEHRSIAYLGGAHAPSWNKLRRDCDLLRVYAPDIAVINAAFASFLSCCLAWSTYSVKARHQQNMGTTPRGRRMLTTHMLCVWRQLHHQWSSAQRGNGLFLGFQVPVVAFSRPIHTTVMHISCSTKPS